MCYLNKVFVAIFIFFLLSTSSTYAASRKIDYSGIVVDIESGKVIYKKKADEIRYPASLAKLMTLYIVFQNLQNEKLSWNQKLKVSKKAASQVPSKLGLKAGQYITVRDAVLSLIIKSANDSAVVLAEKIGKTEAGFAKMMNDTAKSLNMKNTHFVNASGLHDPKQVTTTYEMALLGIAIQKYFENYYPLFAKTHFVYNGKKIVSFNEVLKNYPGADGLKTGFTNASGYNLATSVKKENRKFLGVVMGLQSAETRNNLMVRLLDRSISKVTTTKNKFADNPKPATY